MKLLCPHAGGINGTHNTGFNPSWTEMLCSYLSIFGPLGKVIFGSSFNFARNFKKVLCFFLLFFSFEFLSFTLLEFFLFSFLPPLPPIYYILRNYIELLNGHAGFRSATLLLIIFLIIILEIFSMLASLGQYLLSLSLEFLLWW